MTTKIDTAVDPARLATREPVQGFVAIGPAPEGYDESRNTARGSDLAVRPFEPIAITDDVLKSMQEIGADRQLVDANKLTVAEIYGAAFRRENTVGSVMADETLAPDTDPTPLPTEGIVERLKRDGLITAQQYFQNVQTVGQYEAVRAQIEREAKDKAILDASGWTGTGAQLVASVLDPVNLIPIGGGIAAGAKAAGVAARVGAGAAASAALTETVLQATQKTRTAEESAANIGGSFILGGVLGYGAYRVVGRKQAVGIERGVAAAVQDVLAPEAGGVLGPRASSAGAAMVSDLDQLRTRGLDQSDLLNSSGIATVLKSPAAFMKYIGGTPGKAVEDVFRNPILDLADSSSRVARNFVGDFVNFPWIRRSDVDEKPEVGTVNVRGEVLQWQGRLAQWLREAEDAWKANRPAYIPEGVTAMDRAKTFLNLADDAGQVEFGRRVYRAAVNGGKAADGDRAVEAVAMSLRKTILDPALRELVEQGFLPVEALFKQGKTYVPRVWKKDTIVTRRDEFVDLMERWAFSKLKADLDTFQAQRLAGDPRGYDGFRTRLGLSKNKAIDEDDLTVQSARTANEMYETITGINSTLRDYDVRAPGASKSYLTKRVIDIPDSELEELGFIESNIFEIIKRYVQHAGTDIAIAKRFGRETPETDMEGNIVGMIREPDMSLRDVRDSILTEFSERMRGLDGTSREFADLARERDRTIKSVESLVALARGTYDDGLNQNWRTTVNLALTLNYVRLLGGTVVSSLGDPINIALSNGFGRTISTGVVPIMKEYRRLYQAANGDGRRAMRIAGAVMEHELNSRLATLTDLADPFVEKSHAASFLTKTAQTFSKYSGIRGWTAFWKSVEYNTAQARILENGRHGYDKLTKAERAWMQSLGLGKAEMEKITRAYDGQSTDKIIGGVAWGDHTVWKDQEAASLFRSALARESENVIVTPSLGDRPFIASAGVGKLPFQFKSYMFAAHARLWGRNAQLASIDGPFGQKAGEVYTGLLGLLFAAAVISETKKFLADAGKDDFTASSRGLERWQKNPGSALYDTLDRTGVFGIIFEGSTVLGKIDSDLSIRSGLEVLLRDEKRATVRRKKMRDATDVAADIASIGLGPTGDLLVSSAASAAVMGKWTGTGGERIPERSEFRRGRRVIPFQNVPGMQQLLNYGEQRFGDWAGWPEIPPR